VFLITDGQILGASKQWDSTDDFQYDACNFICHIFKYKMKGVRHEQMPLDLDLDMSIGDS